MELLSLPSETSIPAGCSRAGLPDFAGLEDVETGSHSQ
jgi:hypothetical protein